MRWWAFSTASTTTNGTHGVIATCRSTMAQVSSRSSPPSKRQLLQRLGLELHGERTPLIENREPPGGAEGLRFVVRHALPRAVCRRATSTWSRSGTGEPVYEDFFATLARRYGTRVHFHRGYSDELAHWIEAASDLFLMPSRYEPCGLNQMYSLRYGSVPIVRRTGGLADSVQPFDRASGTGTGIVFGEYSVEAVHRALDAALDLYQDQQLWSRVVQNGMAQDFSWSRQVQRYVELYERLQLLKR